MVSPVDRFLPALPHPGPSDPLENDANLSNPAPVALAGVVPGQIEDLVENLGLNPLKNVEDPNRIFQLMSGCAIGLCFGEKIYDCSDAYIQESAVRRKVSPSLLRKSIGQALRWREKSGLLHLGAGLYTFVPLVSYSGLGLGAYFGFSADVALRYRTLQPEVYSKLINKGPPKKAPEFVVPYTADLARKMPAGSEIEIIGQIRADASAGLFLSAGEAIGPALLGAALFVEGGVSGARELGLSVLALDSMGHLRVTMRKIAEKESSFSLGAAAGCILELSEAAGQPVNGYSTVLASNRSMRNVLDGISSWTATTLGMAHAVASANMSLVSFDLDLNDRAARDIYKDLLLLRLDAATRAAKAHPECAKMAVSNEIQNATSIQGAFSFFSETITDASENNDRIKGRTTLPSGEIISYVDRSITKKQSLWFKWKREVKWQEVKVTNLDGNVSRPFFRFQFAKEDYRYSKRDFFRFLRFSEALGVAREGFVTEDLNEFDALETKLAKAAKVSTDIDIFFTQKGIDNILSTSSYEAEHAFIAASQVTDYAYQTTPLLDESEFGQQARNLLDYYERLTDSRFWDIFQITPRVNRCIADYEKLTGRDLSMDYGLLKQAQNFATIVRSKHEKQDGSKCASGIFLDLARKNKFQFEKTIAALVHLARREETRLHTFSLESGSTKLKAKSEEKLAHPRQEIIQHLSSLK